ncbi:MAG: PAS domain-containing sensor histidine kinase, partial [Deltaproteobacteria bacterium]
MVDTSDTPDFQNALWASLPVPALIIGPGDLIEIANPAAELFLNTSSRNLAGAPVFDRITIDAPLDSAFERVRQDS